MKEKIKKEHEVCLEILKIFHNICEKNNLTYWIDFGTLLGAYRHKGFIPWDNDIDVCMPAEDFKKIIPILIEHCKGDNPYLLFFAEGSFNFWYEYFGNVEFLANGALPVKIDIFPVKFIEDTTEAVAYDKSLTNVLAVYTIGKAKRPWDIMNSHKKLLPHKEDSSEQLKSKKDYVYKIYDTHMLKNNVEMAIKNDYLMAYSINDELVKATWSYFRANDIFPLKKITFEGFDFYAPQNVENHLENLYGNFMKLPPEEERVSSYAKIKKNTISKNKIKELIYLIYRDNVTVYDYDNIGKKETRKKYKIKMFFKVFFYLLFRFRFQSLKNFIAFFLLYHLPNTNKAHLNI